MIRERWFEVKIFMYEENDGWSAKNELDAITVELPLSKLGKYRMAIGADNLRRQLEEAIRELKK